MKTFAWSDIKLTKGIHVVDKPVKLQGDPTFVTMARAAVMFAVAFGMFIWIVIECCRAI
jgi:hypothetical protein